MSITDAEYDIWINNPNSDKVILMELEDSSSNVLYMSNAPYITKPADTDANRPYLDLITSIPKIVSRYDRDATIGKITFLDTGDYDDWLNTKTTIGHPLNLYIGDRSWSRDDFRTLFSGLCGGFYDKQNSLVDINVIDKRIILNKTLASYHVSVTSWIIPRVYGKVTNITPIVNYISLTKVYHYNDVALTINEVRDNGVSRTYTSHVGYFSLPTSSVGDITCDITYSGSQTVTTMVNQLALDAGLSSGEIDLQLTDTRVVGLFVNSVTLDTANALDLLLNPISIKWRFDNEGKLTLLKLKSPSAETADSTLIDDDIVADSIKRVGYESPTDDITVNYNKNWTIQSEDSLAAAVSDADVAYYISEGKSYTAARDVSAYPEAKKNTLNTLLDTSADASAELSNFSSLRSKRYTYSLIVKARLFVYAIGDIIDITAEHYAFNTGTKCFVIGVSENIELNETRLEVWL